MPATQTVTTNTRATASRVFETVIDQSGIAPALLANVVQAADNGRAGPNPKGLGRRSRRAPDAPGPDPVDDAKRKAREFVNELLERQVIDHSRLNDGLDAFLDDSIAILTERLSAQLDAILHDGRYQALEGAFRGLESVFDDPNVSDRFSLDVLPMTKEQLRSEVRAHQSDVTRSALYKKIVRDGYGTVGGIPRLFVALNFDLGPADVDIMRFLSAIGALGHVAFIANAGPAFFGGTDYTAIPLHKDDLLTLFQANRYKEYIDFRKTDNSRYLALALPMILARKPYGPDNPAEGFDTYEEFVDGTDLSNFAWTRAALVMMGRIAASCGRHDGWPGAITGESYGGGVDGMVLHEFSTDTGEQSVVCPTQVALDDDLEMALMSLGFIPLIPIAGSTKAAFYSAKTTQDLGPTRDASIRGAQQLSARLPNVLIASRLSHFLKMILRKMVGGPFTRDRIEKALQSFLNDLVLQNPGEAPLETLALHPLRAARVKVEDVPGAPGTYRAMIQVTPHFLCEAFDLTIEISSEEPGPTAS